MTGNKSLRLVVTDRDRRLLTLLAEARLMDREQIQQLLDFGSITRANDRLSRLHFGGLLYRYFVGTIAGGRKALYAISPSGAAMVGCEVTWKLRYSQNELLVGEPGVEHQLAVNWCWISMQHESGSSLIRFVRFNQPLTATLPLIPDGYAELSALGGMQSIFLEVDLATETSRIWDRKVELYLKLAVSGLFEQRLHRSRFKVAVVCTTERRLESLRRVVRKRTSKLFYFTLLETIKRDGLCASPWLRPEGDAHESIA